MPEKGAALRVDAPDSHELDETNPVAEGSKCVVKASGSVMAASTNNISESHQNSDDSVSTASALLNSKKKINNLEIISAAQDALTESKRAKVHVARASKCDSTQTISNINDCTTCMSTAHEQLQDSMARLTRKMRHGNKKDLDDARIKTVQAIDHLIKILETMKTMVNGDLTPKPSDDTASLSHSDVKYSNRTTSKEGDTTTSFVKISQQLNVIDLCKSPEKDNVAQTNLASNKSNAMRSKRILTDATLEEPKPKRIRLETVNEAHSTSRRKGNTPPLCSQKSCSSLIKSTPPPYTPRSEPNQKLYTIPSPSTIFTREEVPVSPTGTEGDHSPHLHNKQHSASCDNSNAEEGRGKIRNDKHKQSRNTQETTSVRQNSSGGLCVSLPREAPTARKKAQPPNKVEEKASALGPIPIADVAQESSISPTPIEGVSTDNISLVGNVIPVQGTGSCGYSAFQMGMLGYGVSPFTSVAAMRKYVWLQAQTITKEPRWGVFGYSSLQTKVMLDSIYNEDVDFNVATLDSQFYVEQEVLVLLSIIFNVTIVIYAKPPPPLEKKYDNNFT